MSQIRAIIADDEEILRAGLKIMLTKLWPELEITSEAKNGREVLEFVKQNSPDIVFLDIQMPGITGIEVAKKICNQCKVVFVTAYDHYAVEAFESEAVDYLLKPVTEDRLLKAIGRLKKQLESPDNSPDPDMKKIIQILENRDIPERLRLIKVKTGIELRFIPVSQIFFFKAEDKYTVVQTADKQYLIKTPIKELESKLDPELFWRVHRSSIVNIERIQKIKRSFSNQMMVAFNQIDAAIPVSRRFEHLFKQM
ncbi:MAG: response regulator transcription factor [Desulfobacteraceae bacterium]|nr:response regulator transcription factor [Desulfobacteraceae bacterium]